MINKESRNVIRQKKHLKIRSRFSGTTERPRLAVYIDAAAYVGKVIAERAMAANIKEVVFDRGGFIYTGKVKALAEAAREAGLVF